MYDGVLITQSLRPGTELDGMRLVVTKITTFDNASAAADQPTRWTLLYFAVDEADADRLAAWLADSLIAEPGVWYADFKNASEHFVIFPERIFRYRIGDNTARARAVDHGRRLGVPEAQLDWGD
ncbi:hypothetical protein GJV80_14590 [Microlunatus sp. Gsoil 973]|nr:hypothetical protein GJV80_14590 [Microlunatus sp. Gsoil 973]